MTPVHILLLDISSELVAEWQRALAQHLPEPALHRIFTVQSKLSDLPPGSHFDCMVSPANSYGRLDGGYDFFLSEALTPPGVDPAVPTQLAQAALYAQWRGYAPPGTCTLVPLAGTLCAGNARRCGVLALCPTMRTPEDAAWNREVVYNCTWALLCAVHAHNRRVAGGARARAAGDGGGGADGAGAAGVIGSVLMPGLATGVGAVSAERCAQQMVLAIRDYEDAEAHPAKWRALEWDDALAYAKEVRRTHNSNIG